MGAVFVLAGVLLWIITLKGGWRTEPDKSDPA
jgi:hypothetical protein